MDTDASATGLGTVLSQVGDDRSIFDFIYLDMNFS